MPTFARYAAFNIPTNDIEHTTQASESICSKYCLSASATYTRSSRTSTYIHLTDDSPVSMAQVSLTASSSRQTTVTAGARITLSTPRRTAPRSRFHFILETVLPRLRSLAVRFSRWSWSTPFLREHRA